MAKVKLIKQVFEIRYDRGYRYLDRAGEAMLILEEVLPNETKKVWMQEEISPTGAKLKCPDLDIYLFFNAAQLVIDQDPADTDVEFSALSELVYSVIAGRFDLRTTIRMGCRRFFVLPADSVDEAESASVRLASLLSWPGINASVLKAKSSDQTVVFEAPDATTGIRFSSKPWDRPEAPEKIDDRMRAPSHLLPAGQKEALKAQLQRLRQRERAPVAGVLMDVDYYTNRPSKADVRQFIDKAMEETQKLSDAYASRR